jgi:hypothetical protein
MGKIMYYAHFTDPNNQAVCALASKDYQQRPNLFVPTGCAKNNTDGRFT